MVLIICMDSAHFALSYGEDSRMKIGTVVRILPWVFAIKDLACHDDIKLTQSLTGRKFTSTGFIFDTEMFKPCEVLPGSYGLIVDDKLAQHPDEESIQYVLILLEDGKVYRARSCVLVEDILFEETVDAMDPKWNENLEMAS